MSNSNNTLDLGDLLLSLQEIENTLKILQIPQWLFHLKKVLQ